MRVKISHIATQAGVSAATVSQVLNGNASKMRITEETAEIVRRVARQLKYEKPLERNSTKANAWLEGEIKDHLRWILDSSYRIMAFNDEHRYFDIDKQEWVTADTIASRYILWKTDKKV